MPDQKGLFDLTGKVAIVTGSTKGIGRAMAEGLAQAGATIIVSSRKQDLCSEVADQISIAQDQRLSALRATSEIGKPVPAIFVDVVMKQLGRIDICKQRRHKSGENSD